MDVPPRYLPLVVAAACSSAARPPARPPASPAAQTAEPEVHHLNDPDLAKQPPPKLLSIDWAEVKLDDDAGALALWQRIAPTGEDWEDKLGELPADRPEVAHALALALLHDGNFVCAPVRASACAPAEIESPGMTATLTDPCLRRVLALWALSELADDDLPRVHDVLKALAALPPPESQLVARAIDAVPESDQDTRLELDAIAWAAGQREVVAGKLGGLDAAHLITAAVRHHIGDALDHLAAAAQRAPFLKAIADEKMATAARVGAMVELSASSDKLAPDVRLALVAATKSADCTVAANAAHTLDAHGEHRYVPKPPRSTAIPVMMRSLCVLASYEALLRSDEGTYLPAYVPPAGLELVSETYDAYENPPIKATTQIVKPAEVVFPEVDDLIRAMKHCTGTTCTSDDHEFRFGWKPIGGQLYLAKLEMHARPACGDKQTIPVP